MGYHSRDQGLEEVSAKIDRAIVWLRRLFIAGAVAGIAIFAWRSGLAGF